MDTPGPHAHDEWIKTIAQQKKGRKRQLYFQPDGTINPLHIKDVLTAFFTLIFEHTRIYVFYVEYFFYQNGGTATFRWW